MTKVLEAITSVQEAPADETLRITRRIEIGSVIQQGDVYLHRVADDHPRGEQIGKDCVQIALGTGNGARHTVEGKARVYRGVELPPGVTAPMGVEESEILGPLVVADEAAYERHPEHPHHRFPKGTYQVTYQADLRTMRRVVD